MYSKTEQNSFFSTGDFLRPPGALDLFSNLPFSAAPGTLDLFSNLPFSDQGATGFMDQIGFVSCTEELGCESSGDGLIESRGGTEVGDCSTIWGRERRRIEERKRVIDLPPPLTSFDKNGRRDFILRPVRKDGRLQLTEVKISRPEIMRATREDGRLTLRLVGCSDDEESDDEVDEEKTEDLKGEEEIEDCGVDKDDCKSPASGGGEGGDSAALRRCYEYEVAGQQHLWSPRFVTTM